MTHQPRSFEEFWPYYLMEHRNPGCRMLHFVGSTGALFGLVLALVRLDPLWIPAGLVFAYAMAWIGHFAVEHNRPATFKWPLWSFAGDVRMYVLWLGGRLAPTLADVERSLAGGETIRALDRT